MLYRGEDEQIKAQNTLGSFMELRPISLPDMIHLMKLCGDLPRNQIQIEDGNTSSQSRGGRRSSFILPGTLWCGVRDRAPRYENLGPRKRLDNCCRTHDHCPLKVGSFENRYGLTNFGFATRSHCLCDNEFFHCLKNVGNEVANMIANFFFEILRVECLQPLEKKSHHDTLLYPVNNLYYCDAYDEVKKCRFWKKRKVSYDYKFERSIDETQYYDVFIA
ncbi:Acidic phospholipase A2 PA4 [Armadillidium nasatum]|uniref:Acidic phospholipase A2 PA4 n=1 Tax=Armadillidium nasatum TaxID=96803 RepID=A0A5N5THR7_9CRUS|nr:Acidic phospholipase A2 PA4 [Armadillidium nasatum]